MDGFEGGSCQDAERVCCFAAVGEDAHDGVLSVQAQDPGDGGLEEDAFDGAVACLGAQDGFVPDGILCRAGGGGEHQVQDVGGEHGGVLEENHCVLAGGGPVVVEGVDDGGGYCDAHGVCCSWWSVVFLLSLGDKNGSGFLPGCRVGGVWIRLFGRWVFWLVSVVFKFF